MSAKQSTVKIILGTHLVGDGSKDSTVTFDRAEDVNALLDRFASYGYNELDTSAMYSPGAPGSSEQRLGSVGAASKFTIHTKTASGKPGDHEPSKIHASIDKSLSSLNTSTVETIFLHLPDRQTPFEDTARAINEAYQQGKFKHFGLSNYTAEEVASFIEITERNGWVKPSVFEGHYNAIVRGGEEKLFPLLRKHNISFFAYSPAAGGIFSETSKRFAGDDFVAKLYQELYGKPEVQSSITKVRELAAKHNLTGHAVALRWVAFHSVLDAAHGDAILVGVSKLEQLDKSLGSIADGPLPAEIADAITAIYATVKGSEPPYHM